MKILSVRPGITSPASVLYHNEEALLCAEDVFRQYVARADPRQDAPGSAIRAAPLLLPGSGYVVVDGADPASKDQIARAPERLLFVGPITRLVQRYVNWFVADLLVTLVAVGSTGLLWRIYGPLNVGWLKSVAAALALVLLFSVTGAVLGVNRIAWSKAAPKDVYDLLAGVGHRCDIGMCGQFASRCIAFRAGNHGLTTGSRRLCCRQISKPSGHRPRELHHAPSHQGSRKFVSTCTDCRIWSECPACSMDAGSPRNSRKFQVFGFVDDDLFAQGMRVHGADVVGTYDDIPKLVTKHDIGVIILADRSITLDQYRSIEELCRTAKTRFAVMPNIVDSLSGLCRGASLPHAAEDAARDSVDFHCLQCLIRHGAEQVSSPLQQSSRAEVISVAASSRAEVI